MYTTTEAVTYRAGTGELAYIAMAKAKVGLHKARIRSKGATIQSIPPQKM